MIGGQGDRRGGARGRDRSVTDCQQRSALQLSISCEMGCRHATAVQDGWKRLAVDPPSRWSKRRVEDSGGASAAGGRLQVAGCRWWQVVSDRFQIPRAGCGGEEATATTRRVPSRIDADSWADWRRTEVLWMSEPSRPRG